jgi:UDP-N-acetylmuramoyl-tripeptide--D-alanyl-D-alanine ligase
MICRLLRDIERMTRGSGLEARFEEREMEGVSIDSRTIQPGNLFVPIIRNLDGHYYVDKAFAKGASAALWQKDHPHPPSDVPIIYVDDCLLALQNLASAYRCELAVKVIGVTGSNGKTTTKDMLNAVLGTTYQVHKTFGNLNSQIGVPLTILDMDESTEIAVIEMGMSERGQIERLSHIAKPDIAIITMIGVSHLSSLGSREAIAEAKLEIISGIPDEGTLVYNGDEPLLTAELKELSALKSITMVSFGEGKTNDYYAASIEGSSSDGTFFTVHDYKFYIPLIGAHNITNALATIAAAVHVGLDLGTINDGFRALHLTGMRMEKILTPNGVTIINDAWNASPVSMNAAIQTFENLSGYLHKYAVLGDMLELGEDEVDYHKAVGKNINPAKIEYVYTIGALGQHIAAEAEHSFPEGHVQAFLEKKKLLHTLQLRLKPGDAILFKGSRGLQLETVINALL